MDSPLQGVLRIVSTYNALSLFAVGDLHGDMQKTKKSLQLARVAAEKEDGKLVWTGGDTVVVQLGDVLDRGDCEIGEAH